MHPIGTPAADPSPMTFQEKPDKLMEWLRLVLKNTKFSRLLPVLSSCLSTEQIDMVIAVKESEEQEIMEKEEDNNDEGDWDEDAANDDTKEDKITIFNEISDEEEAELEEAELGEEEEDTKSSTTEEDMNEQANDFDEILNHMKHPEKREAETAGLKVDQRRQSPTPKNDIQTRKNVGRPKTAPECKDCFMVFETRRAKNYHMETIHSDNDNICSICQEQFSTSGSLRRHSLVHQDGRHFPCQMCVKVFKRNCALKEHTRIHTGEKPFSCQHCEYRASSSSLLSHHRKRCKSKRLFG